MSEGAVRLAIEDGVASVVFDRPEARNAMTWSMYEALVDICERLERDATVRIVTFRGAGGQSFIAGTDIAQFLAFEDGEAGIAYEERVEACIARIEALPQPTVAIVEGMAVGGGLVIAAACDFRIATPSSVFGVPIAKTVGNCLSARNVARLAAGFGENATRRMLLLADFIDAQEALARGFVLHLAEPGSLEEASRALCTRLAKLAPVTQRVSKETLNRLALDTVASADDLIRQCYGSADFKEGVSAFVGKRSAQWRGR